MFVLFLYNKMMLNCGLELFQQFWTKQLLN